jgi:hypothetical protein
MTVKKVVVADEFNFQGNVKDQITSAALAALTPAKGDRYIVTDGANQYKIALCTVGGGSPTWEYITVSEGFICWDESENKFYKFITTWIEFFSDVFKNDGSVNPTNLLFNGDFNYWSAGASAAPDGWTLAGADAVIERSIARLLPYSAKLTRVDADCEISQRFESEKGLLYWRGKTVTLGGWVYASVADRVRIGIYEDVPGSTYSSYHPGDSEWHWLSVTVTINLNTTEVYAKCYVDTGNTDGYFDGIMLIQGASSFTFSPKPLCGDVPNEIYSLADKATPVDADVTLIEDSASTPTNQKKKLTWANIKATLKTYFDSLYSLGFVDRGDPSAYDFTLTDFTTDGNYYDLDLSAIVPAGAKAVIIRIIAQDDATGSIVLFRKNGTSNAYNIMGVRTQVSGVFADGIAIVAVDTNRVVEYRTSNTTYSAINVSVCGWFI